MQSGHEDASWAYSAYRFFSPKIVYNVTLVFSFRRWKATMQRVIGDYVNFFVDGVYVERKREKEIWLEFWHEYDVFLHNGNHMI